LWVGNHLVERVRDGKRNEYVVDGQVLKGFGSDVPETVREIVPFDDVNIQRQFDAPFILGYSPVEVARILGEMLELDVVNEVFSAISKRKWAVDAEINTVKSRLAELKRKIDGLWWVDEVGDIIAGVEALAKRRGEFEEKIEIVQDTVSRILEIQQQMPPETAEAERILFRVDALYERRDKIEEKYVAVGQHVKWLIGILESMPPDVSEAEPVLSEIEWLGEKQRQMEMKIDDVQDAVMGFAKAQDRYGEVVAELQKVEEEFHEQMGDVCPLCGQSIRREK